MTNYAIDEDTGTLLRIWPTGRGQRAAVVGALPAAAREDRLRLAAALTSLSEALWRCYTHPGLATDDPDGNGEGWRREQSREVFSQLVGFIKEPNLPGEGGAIIESYDPVEEWAHSVGRAVRAIGDAKLFEAVSADVAAEIEAVESAERGDLSGRAQQAVVLSRTDVNPVQVAAADGVLALDPLNGEQLFVNVDPTAASVAAAHWLKAAADVVAEVSGMPADEVVQAADDIEALPVETPSEVLRLFDFSDTAYGVVVEMVRGAVQVGEGSVADLGALLVEHDTGDDSDDPEAEPTPVRLTVLDPQRPALDLLEDLLTGIHGCRLVYEEYVDAGDAAATDTQFCEAVREQAKKAYTRLM
ncbi:hypothetical protein GCM10010172_31970 [Paractinoplanes ferrugineus]|uniref:Uncharacterized protein n=1 Tax=Paractinoplanes ferrugineus TaxID=113564 RepID=A0A919J3H9_9ACTN|nr:hypothetical protein [Actinoplanes ferrugineus]GIE14111.1 hypothetical protein Afe05nite_59510 [Actinoplanes ferrugineus]